MSQRMRILCAIPSFQAQNNYYGLLAEIEYHTFRKTKIRYGGQEISASDFFRKKGWNAWGKNYAFTGHSGIEYLWRMDTDKCKLFVNDSSETLVASFHHMHTGIIHQATPAFLEIFGDNLDDRTIDLIIVTFVYMERRRREQEETLNA